LSAKKNEILLLLAIIAFSILLRLPQLNRPISKHHEFNVGFFLQTMQIWNETSAFNYHFLHVCNFQNPNDKFIPNLAFKNFHKDGTLYYASFPPFSYILPYTFFQVISLPINVFYLQIFNLILFIIFSLNLYFIIRKMGNNIEYKIRLFSMLIWATMPAVLWFHGNAYTHQVLFSVLLSINVLSLVNIEKTFAKYLFFISLFLCLYTDWAGFLLAWVYWIYYIFNHKKYKESKLLLLLIPLLSAFTLALIVWQYGSFIGYDNYFQYMKMRFFTRSNISNFSQFFILPFSLVQWIFIGFGSSILLIILLIFKLKNPLFSISKILLWFGIIFHLIFSNFTQIHDYSVIVNSVLIALLLYQILHVVNTKTLYIIAFAVVVSNIIQYYYINRIGQVAQNGDRYDMYEKIGKTIQNNSNKDEVIFLHGMYMDNCPQLLWYAQRNYFNVQDTNFCSYLHPSHSRKIAVFNIQNNQVKSVQHLTCK